MKRLTNIFSALQLVDDDDEDLAREVSSKTSAAVSSTKSNRGNGNDGKNLSEIPAKSNGNEGIDDKTELSKPLVWIDLEMTGLNLQKDRILEIACIITDGKLEKMIEGPDLIIHQPEDVLAKMNDWCQEHHTTSGLTDGVRNSTISEKEAEKQVLEFLSQHVAPGRGLLAGNSVYIDLLFLQKHMPKLADYFPHVLVDVSSLRAICIRWYPRDAKNAPEKKKTHRALEDIKESIAELRYMQGTIFKPPKKKKF